MREKVLAFADTLPGAVADQPFSDDFETTILRHENNKKWFGALLKVPRHRLGLDGEGSVEVLNLKCAPEDAITLREMYRGVLAGYHMNKLHWITVLPASDVPDSVLEELILQSYELTKTHIRKRNNGSVSY